MPPQLIQESQTSTPSERPEEKMKSRPTHRVRLSLGSPTHPGVVTNKQGEDKCQMRTRGTWICKSTTILNQDHQPEKERRKKNRLSIKQGVRLALSAWCSGFYSCPSPMGLLFTSHQDCVFFCFHPTSRINEQINYFIIKGLISAKLTEF